MAQINTLQSNHYEDNLNASHRLDKYYPDMVVTDIKAGNSEKLDLSFQWYASRLVGIYTILIEYVLMENEVGNYESKLSIIKERLKNCVIFIGETYIDDS